MVVLLDPSKVPNYGNVNVQPYELSRVSRVPPVPEYLMLWVTTLSY